MVVKEHTSNAEKEYKILLLILYLSSLSMNTTAKILNVTEQTIMHRIQKMYDKFIKGKPDITVVKDAEMDEMRHHY